ncbi:MAG: tRNA lysidine(34) synthetase TilS [Betaproteobacteria bacterium]|nr:tRNA lysidine(34) synthetase TilS [Pseudomonadota bacterium]NBO11461.1 tRNA lysidine(34) synthetase TilS [Betaproteobacteria bacterium]NBO43921.1 tRNA lysidine(34) synthetase TilS [Betaproteobacteria bacterium]NBP10735.1 tRNA lysidine(34) synthetase TilS [Betaproteobacteria bacterium]NBP62550.1 tRNA lysidine(34) synthetase TilS [Betaproteobacteria bacterium]
MLGPLRQALIQSLAAFPGPCLLAVSGGLDSSVLLVAMRKLWPERLLHAVHVHHGLQVQADAFETAVERLCAQWAVRLHVCRLQAPAVFVDGVEAWARQARYAAIEALAQDFGFEQLLLAHHADDQAETFFINLIRGTGIDGLRGMPLAAKRNGLIRIRPLLTIPRLLLHEQAIAWGLSWIDDPSNLDRRFLRNRIRMELMPLLESIRPGSCARVVDLMRDLAQAPDDFPAANATMELGSLSELPEAAQRQALHDWVRQVALRAPSRARLNALYELCFVSKTAKGHLKHGDFVFRRLGDRLIAGPRI